MSIDNSDFLMNAILNNDINIVRYLVSLGANIQNGLALASSNGYLDLVECLLDLGADIHAQNDSALYYANTLDITIFLVNKGANIMRINNNFIEYKKYIKEIYDNLRYKNYRNLFPGIKDSTKNFKKYDLANNIYFRSKSYDIFNIFFLQAVEINDIERIKYLLNRGVDIHTQNDRALMIASKNGNLDLVRYLISKGADINLDT